MLDTILLFGAVAVLSTLVSWSVAYTAVVRAHQTQEARSRTSTSGWHCLTCDRSFGTRTKARDHALDTHNAPPEGDDWLLLFNRGDGQ